MNGKAYSSHLNCAPYFNIISNIARSVGAQRYLELGLWDAKNHRSMLEIVPYCVGVDCEKMFEGEIPHFHHMTTDAFFEQNTEKFDIIFIDASHEFSQVAVDFENSIKVLEKHGVIFLHDTDPAEEYMIVKKLCNDTYKITEYIRKNHTDFSIVTLPVSNMGLSICNRTDELRHKRFSSLSTKFTNKIFENIDRIG